MYSSDTSTEAVGKILFGGDSEEQEQLDLRHSLASASHELITDITKTLRYYTAHKKSNVVEKLFVCGGFSLVPGFVELLNNRLPVAAVLWNPFEKLRSEAPGDCEELITEKGPEMAVAAGLAMRQV